MNAGPIPDLLSIVLSTWLLGLAAMILLAIVSGRVFLRGLFTTDIDGDGIADEFHMERVQLLIMTVFGIGGYAMAALTTLSEAKTAMTVLPEVSDELLMMLGASNTFYLSGKFGRTLQRG
jgi:hypothetical protein